MATETVEKEREMCAADLTAMDKLNEHTKHEPLKQLMDKQQLPLRFG